MSNIDVTTIDPETGEHGGPVGSAAEISGGNAKNGSRHLIIRVIEDGKPRANIRLPLGLARMGMKFIPAKEKENLKQQGIDTDEILSELTGEEVGPLVQVDEEGKSVWIGVE